jgi:hypothetical protein
MGKILRFPKRKLTQQERRAKLADEMKKKNDAGFAMLARNERKRLRHNYRQSLLKARAAARKTAATNPQG